MTAPPQTQFFRHYTKIPFEILIAVFTVLPFFAMACFYSAMSDHVPLFMTFKGDVAVWGHKSLLSVFRAPLLAVVMQVVCVLMKYGTLQSKGVAALQIGAKEEHYLSLNAGLWDWFRWTVAFKMSAASLDTVFLSIERFRFLSRPTFIVTAIAALIGAGGALFYVYRLLVMRRRMKEAFSKTKDQRKVDATRVYGRVFYFNPSDPDVFADKYIFNFANKWASIFIACFLIYPLLVFLPQ